MADRIEAVTHTVAVGPKLVGRIRVVDLERVDRTVVADLEVHRTEVVDLEVHRTVAVDLERVVVQMLVG